MYYENFDQLCHANNVKPGRVSRETGISTATLTSWKQGKYTPKQDKLQKIADFFGVPLGVITGDMPELDVDYVIKRLEEKEEQQRIDAETSAIYMKEFQEQIRQESIKDREKFLANIVTIYNTLSYDSAKDLCDYAEYLKYRDFKRSKEKINEE